MNIILKKYDKFIVAFMALLFFLIAFFFWFTQKGDVELFKGFKPLKNKLSDNSFGKKVINSKEIAVHVIEPEVYFQPFENVFQRELTGKKQKYYSNIFSPGTFMFCEKDRVFIPVDVDVCPICGTTQRTFRPTSFDTDSDGGGLRDDVQLLLNEKPIVRQLAEFLGRAVYFNITNPKDDCEDSDGDGFTNAEEMVGVEVDREEISERAFDPTDHPALANLLRFRGCENMYVPIFLNAKDTAFVGEDKNWWEANISLMDGAFMRASKMNESLLALPFKVKSGFFGVKIGDRVFQKYIEKHGGKQSRRNVLQKLLKRDFEVVDLEGDASNPRIVVMEVIRQGNGWNKQTEKYVIDSKEPTKLPNEYLVTMSYLIDRVEPEKGTKASLSDLEKERCIEMNVVVVDGKEKRGGFTLVIPKETDTTKMKDAPIFKSVVGYEFLVKELYKEETPSFKPEEYRFVGRKGKYPIFKRMSDEAQFTIEKRFSEKDLIVPNNELIAEPSLASDGENQEEKGAEKKADSRVKKEQGSKL